MCALKHTKTCFAIKIRYVQLNFKTLENVDTNKSVLVFSCCY